MKLANDIITVFNKRIDSENGWNIYIPSVIKNVSWYGTVKTEVSNSGLNAANQYIVRIPLDADFGGKEYVDPIVYDNSTIVSGLFTLANGDFIVKAEVTESASLTPAQIQSTYHDCMTVLGVTDNRRAPHAPHFRVVGG